jgi:F-type H+-transporting ATPase subunit delta
MIEGRLARRYATALFQLAREAGQEEAVGQEIAEFQKTFSASELQSILTNPAFALDSRKRIIIQVANAQRLSVLTTHFLSLLLDRDRLAYLAEISSGYQRLLNEAKGRIEAKVVSAMALEPAQVERLLETLQAISGKTVILQRETDPALIGGLRVELEGRIYDGSVSTRLAMMRERMARGYY